MVANIDHSTGKAAIAFVGSRNDIWHRMGQEKVAGASIDSWATDSGLAWEAIKVPAYAFLNTPHFDHLPDDKRMRLADKKRHLVRSDNGYTLGIVSERYQPVQPREVLDWFDRYISVDERFQLDVAGALKHGETIWATATYHEALEVAGERHQARLLMTTTYDGTGSTINQGTMTRTVCANTLAMAVADKRAVIKTRHNTKFDAEAVGKELAAIAQGFVEYKKIGDALALHHMAKEDTSKFFKEMLDIPFDAVAEDISTRKMNQFSDLNEAYKTSVLEGAEKNSAWAVLQAITRYVDHDRSTKSANGQKDEARFTSAQFGSGAALKAKAVSLLLPRIKVPV